MIVCPYSVSYKLLSITIFIWRSATYVTHRPTHYCSSPCYFNTTTSDFSTSDFVDNPFLYITRRTGRHVGHSLQRLWPQDLICHVRECLDPASGFRTLATSPYIVPINYSHSSSIQLDWPLLETLWAPSLHQAK